MNYRKWTLALCGAAALSLGAVTSWAGNLNPDDAFQESKIGVAARFIPIPANAFLMGSPENEYGHGFDETRHEVRLTENFAMQATDVTQLQYFMVMHFNPSVFKNAEDCDENNFIVAWSDVQKKSVSLCMNHPVENISWNDAQYFIDKLNHLQNKYVYRLPTEAEWEFAARGTAQPNYPYFFGYNETNLLELYGWHYGNSGGRSHAVASKGANRYGLYDMNGNVWQWTQDYYGSYPTTAVVDPTGPVIGDVDGDRVIRGGSWSSFSEDLRSARRIGVWPNAHFPYLGFRLVRALK